MISLITHIQRRAWLHILVMGAVAIAAASPVYSEEISPLIVVTSRDDGRYESVVSGVRNVLENRRAGETLRVHSLKSGGEAAVEVLRSAKLAGGVPLLTIGTAATRAALEAPGNAPVIACMAVKPEDLSDVENATGVVLEFPLETQLEWIRRFVPKSQSIGVLYNPAENEGRIIEARKIAKRLGMRVVAREVHRPQDLPGALDNLAREVDLLWAVTDQTVLSRQTAQAILLFSFRNRMPFSGLSASWVKAGALYALERDYEDLGAQCAEMAMKVKRGRDTSTLPPAVPRKVVYTLNLKTAEHLKLNLPEEIVDGAAEVFR